MLGLWPLIGLSMIALAIGAVLGVIFKEKGWGLAALKGLMASFLGGLLIIHLLPEAYAKLGPMSLVYMLAGFLLMLLPEKLAGHNDHHGGQRFFTAEILWIGLIFHQLTDGIALGVASEDFSNDFTLALMVIAHRIPVAAVVVWLFRRKQQAKEAWLRIGAMGLATIAGAVFASTLAPILDSYAVSIFYAVVAGSFLHLVSHDFLDHHAHSVRDRRWEFLAFVAGLAMLVVTEGLLGTESHAAVGAAHSHHSFDAFLEAFLVLVKETAPYLLLGLLISGLLHAYMPDSPITWLQRGSTTTQSLKGMAFGLPLPNCSCGVLPLFLSLSRKGVPPACAVAFLIATPELGIDSFLLSVKLLGWKFSMVRLAVAIVLPVVIALIAVRFLTNPATTESVKGCCPAQSQEKPKSWWRFASIDLVDDIFPVVFFGLLVAALAQVMWPESRLAELVGVWDVLLLGLLGIPFYVCASASIPFALVLLQHGFSVGAVVVFLFAGPATNVATILTVNQAFGKRSGLKLAATAFITAVATGFFINAVFKPEILDVIELHQHGGWSIWESACVAAIGLLGLASLYRSGPLHWISNVVGMIPGVVHHPPTEHAKH